jgi:hypothetical protein
MPKNRNNVKYTKALEVPPVAVPLEVPPKALTVAEKLLIAKNRQQAAAGMDVEDLRLLNAKDITGPLLGNLKIDAAELARQALEDEA